MSEPVTNAEIEDVLSAVRRLVSAADPDAREDKSGPRSALVLTPAFRVDAPEKSPGPDRAETSAPQAAAVQEALADGADAATRSDGFADVNLAPTGADGAEDAVPEAPMADLTDSDDDDLRSLEERIAELEAVVGDAADPLRDFEADGSEPHDPVDTIVFRRAPVAPADASDVGPLAKEADETSEPDVEALIAGMDGVEVTTPDEPAPVESTLQDQTEVDAQVNEWVDFENNEMPYDVEDVPEDDEAEVPVSDRTDDSLTGGANDDTIDMAAFSYASDDYAGPFDPNGARPSGEDYAAYDEDEDRGTDDDLVIDEDMLREIVARLVREELQGTMGERITRNLRRMVRREIARALALKDFD